MAAHRENWFHERESAWLYRRVAEHEPDPRKQQLFNSLAEAAERQALRWSAHGGAPAIFVPTLRARVVGRLLGWVGPRPLKPVIFQMFTHTVQHGEWGQASARGDYALRWRSEHTGKQFRGSAWVDSDDCSTRVVMACETLDAVPVRMKFLLPRLTDLVDLMLAIRT